ncbi:MAG: aspartyl protease family protein [Planctomycetota bacterium]|jgi:hypothetical protein
MKGSSQHFNAFTTTFRGRANKLLTQLAISAAYDPHHPPSPPAQTHKVTALWDTGATGSVISPKVVIALGLHPTGAVMVSTAGGDRMMNTYIVNLTLPNSVGVAGVIVTETDAIKGYDAIVGMDIISRGDFAVTNVGGQTLMSYRYPSIRAVDFVREANEIRYAGVKPNAPCPCGRKKPNGKPYKFKKCCRSKVYGPTPPVR